MLANITSGMKLLKVVYQVDTLGAEIFAGRNFFRTNFRG